MTRLDTNRQNELEPERMKHAISRLEELGYSVFKRGKTCIQFEYKGSSILFYPYSGWHTGKGINDGRGLGKLIKQLHE